LKRVGRGRKRTFHVKILTPVGMRRAVLALCFLLGAGAGRTFAASLGASGANELGQYLSDYYTLWEQGGSFSWSLCALQYLGYGVLLFLFGFSSMGLALIPVLSAVFGFLTMYTVSCFTLVYGKVGISLVLSLLSVRLMVTLPCFFAMANEAWPPATELALLCLGKGQRSAPVLYTSRYFLLFVLCFVILTAGICLERFLTPTLFRLAMRELA